MKIEDKVVSLELAKRMKELGWDYETERYWIKQVEWIIVPYKQEYFCYPAPDAIEIGERLPHYSQTKFAGTNEIWIGNAKYYPPSFETTGKNEAEIRGKMWCYLKEKEIL